MIWPIWAILEFFKITCFGRAMVERQAGTICAFIKEFKMFLTFFSFKTIVTSFLYFYKQIYPTYSLTNFTLDQKISSLFYNYASKFVSKCSLSSRKIAKNWRIEFFSRNFSPSLLWLRTQHWINSSQLWGIGRLINKKKVRFLIQFWIQLLPFIET